MKERALPRPGDEAKTNSTMSRNSPEYCSIVKATGKLTRALKNNITPICADLVSNHLITPDQQKKLRNPTRDAIESAADLVQLLTDKVEENPANYHTLVRILEEDKTTYRDVLERLALPSDSTPGPHAGKSADISSGRILLLYGVFIYIICMLLTILHFIASY